MIAGLIADIYLGIRDAHITTPMSANFWSSRLLLSHAQSDTIA